MNSQAFLSGYLSKEAFLPGNGRSSIFPDMGGPSSVPGAELLKSTLRRALGHGALGGAYGAIRGKEEGETRPGAIARSGVRGAGIGAGATLGQEAAKQLTPQGASHKTKSIAQLLGLAGGGLAGYAGAAALTPVEKPVKRTKPREEQMMSLTKKLQRQAR